MRLRLSDVSSAIATQLPVTQQLLIGAWSLARQRRWRVLRFRFGHAGFSGILLEGNSGARAFVARAPRAAVCLEKEKEKEKGRKKREKKKNSRTILQKREKSFYETIENIYLKGFLK